jgi:hypothetical protein
MDLLNAKNLVELHEKLNEFATYHKNKGGQEAHKLIKNELVDKVKSPFAPLAPNGFNKKSF